MTILRYQPATEDHDAGYSEPALHETLREYGDAARRSPVKGGFVNLMPVFVASQRLGKAFQSLIHDTSIDEDGQFSYPSIDDLIERYFSELGLSADILSQEAPLRQCLDRVIEDVLEHAAAIFRRDTLTFAKEQELSISSRQLQPIIDRQIALLKAQLLDLMPVFVQALFRRYLRNAAGLAGAYLKFHEDSKGGSAERGKPKAGRGNLDAGRAGFDDSSSEALRAAIDTRKRELIFQVLAVANAYAGLGQRPLTLLDQPVSVTPDMSDAERNFVASVAALVRQQMESSMADILPSHDGVAVDEGLLADEGQIDLGDPEESVDEVALGDPKEFAYGVAP